MHYLIPLLTGLTQCLLPFLLKCNSMIPLRIPVLQGILLLKSILPRALQSINRVLHLAAQANSLNTPDLIIVRMPLSIIYPFSRILSALLPVLLPHVGITHEPQISRSQRVILYLPPNHTIMKIPRHQTIKL